MELSKADLRSLGVHVILVTDQEDRQCPRRYTTLDMLTNSVVVEQTNVEGQE